jgi:hypothetical protein
LALRDDDRSRKQQSQHQTESKLMTIRKPLASMLVACSVLFSVSAEVFAIGVTPPNSYSTHASQGGKVTLGEGQYVFPSNTVGYHIDALAGSPAIYGFFVSHNAFGSLGAAPAGWNTTSSLAANWNNGVTFSYLGAGDANVSVNSTALGSFQSLFGNDTLVMFYRRAMSSGVPISDGSATDVNQANWLTTTPLFTRTQSVDTQFLALGGNGQIIDGSLFTSTPEPSSLALSVMSIAGLAAFRRRRKAQKSD